MRPKKKTYTLAAADDNSYLDDATGAGPWATILAQPGDGCGHPVTITSGSDLHTKTITITGTDAEGRALTEAITGPNAAVVTSTGYFATVTSVSASATIGAATMDVGWTALARTPTYPTSPYQHGAHNTSVALGGTTAAYTVQASNDRIYDNNPAIWHNVGIANCTVDQVIESADGTTATRVDVASHTSGVLYITHSQARD